MAIDTPLDQIIDYKSKAIKKIKNSKEIMGLIFNDPNIDMESDEVYEVEKNNLFDYTYDPNTIQTDKAILFVEASMVDSPTANIQNFTLTVDIVCNCGYIKLDTKKFKGTKGNRVDNIARQVVTALYDEEQDYGIGDLTLTQCRPVSVPKGFTAVELVYEVPDFQGWN